MSDTPKLTLSDLADKVPAPFAPWVADYGPVFLKWTAEDFKRWLELLISGDWQEAYGQLVNSMDHAGRISEWGKINAELKTVNADNAARMDIQRQAALTFLKIALAIGLAAFGF